MKIILVFKYIDIIHIHHINFTFFIVSFIKIKKKFYYDILNLFAQ